ncbi:putative metalloprotease CJM1_0395 family protein [Azospirillum soli]|uniref:putative metalloprotease CJM1_0395 family protein n=1 Tax=Azospirillum soli TaxID=1304799 RepID=UPI0031B890ED|nr:hypothetical protein [Azospirillum soli]
MISGVSSSALFGLPQTRTGRKTGAQTDAQAGAADEVQSPEQQQRTQELQRTDTSVRQHEAAHQAAGGPHAGAASFTYTRGPDGKNYAVAGEVPVDTSPEREPEATIRKMETVKAAALAPSDPSAQDLRVAQQADAQKAQAQQELRRKQSSEEAGGQNGTAAPALAARGAAAYGAAQGLGQPMTRSAITV